MVRTLSAKEERKVKKRYGLDRSLDWDIVGHIDSYETYAIKSGIIADEEELHLVFRNDKKVVEEMTGRELITRIRQGVYRNTRGYVKMLGEKLPKTALEKLVYYLTGLRPGFEED